MPAGCDLLAKDTAVNAGCSRACNLKSVSQYKIQGLPMENLDLLADEWVEVRSKEEILATLDMNGQLDSLPFMPEMLEFCGKKLKVFKRAHKTCDTVNDYKGRKLEASVHLDGVRCDGRAHGGCEAGCLIFWKEAWLKRLPSSNMVPSRPLVIGRPVSAKASCNDRHLADSVIAPGEQNSSNPTYVCQATRVPDATKPLPWWDLRQYMEDYTSGNERFTRMLYGFIYATYVNASNLGIGIGRPMRWFYDQVQRVVGGVPFPRYRGSIRKGERTPDASLDLQPGDVVRVKAYKDILATLDTENKNRGLYFDAEYVPYCGGTFRVLRRVTTIVNEKNGKLLKFKTPAVILEEVFCRSRYSHDRMFCPRGIYAYWREVWLEKASPEKVFRESERLDSCPFYESGHVVVPCAPSDGSQDRYQKLVE